MHHSSKLLQLVDGNERKTFVNITRVLEKMRPAALSLFLSICSGVSERWRCGENEGDLKEWQWLASDKLPRMAVLPRSFFLISFSSRFRDVVNYWSLTEVIFASGTRDALNFYLRSSFYLLSFRRESIRKKYIIKSIFCPITASRKNWIESLVLTIVCSGLNSPEWFCISLVCVEL